MTRRTGMRRLTHAQQAHSRRPPTVAPPPSVHPSEPAAERMEAAPGADVHPDTCQHVRLDRGSTDRRPQALPTHRGLIAASLGIGGLIAADAWHAFRQRHPSPSHAEPDPLLKPAAPTAS